MSKTVHIPDELHRAICIRVASALPKPTIADFVADLLRSGLGATRVDRCNQPGAGAPQRSRRRRASA